MDTKTLLIIQGKKGWDVHWQGESFSIFNEEKQDAIRLAMMSVGGVPQGFCSQVLLQHSNGESEAIWTYGKDKYPLPWWQQPWRRIF